MPKKAVVLGSDALTDHSRHQRLCHRVSQYDPLAVQLQFMKDDTNGTNIAAQEIYYIIQARHSVGGGLNGAFQLSLTSCLHAKESSAILTRQHINHSIFNNWLTIISLC